MIEPLSTNGLRDLLGGLCRSVADRVPAEGRIPAEYSERKEAAKKHYQKAAADIDERYDREKSAAQQEAASARMAALARFDSDHGSTQCEYDKVREAVASRREADDGAARKTCQEARWEATTVFEATKDGPAQRFRQTGRRIEAHWRELVAIHQRAIQLLSQRWQWREYPEAPAGRSPEGQDPGKRLTELVSLGRKQLRALAGQFAGRLFEGPRPLGIFVLLWLALAAVYWSGIMHGCSGLQWVAASGGIAAVLSTALGIWLYRVVRRRSTEAYLELRATMAEAERLRREAMEAAKALCQQQRESIRDRMDRDLKKADDEFSARAAEIEGCHRREREEAERKYPALLGEITARRDREILEIDESHRQRLDEIESRFGAESKRLEEDHAREMADSQRRFRHEWDTMADRWRQAVEHFHATTGQMNRTCDRLFRDWQAQDRGPWTPPAEVPPAIRFGAYDVRLARIEGGIPKDERLQPPQTEFRASALLPFPEHSLLLLNTENGEGRAHAVEAIQAIMLRMLTAMPPAKVRFTIIDPVGLGENFSAFMHLADYDEKLVASRIWTESAHIEQRLADLTEHMETVIQVYLRNEFDSIQEYNAFAGELAEPYRVLVVANFPANFSENAARRLRSIVASGARCGVYTLMSFDAKLQLPRDFHMSDLQPHAFELRWTEGGFVWDHPDYGEAPLEVDKLPAAEQFTEIVRRVGQEVREAGRVEVPFDCVVPEPDKWWTTDSRQGIEVPLGRAGAKKLQPLKLGQGTSQHVLVAGKTGSGKSTLWHALITNAALRYSPDEIELYLVDFKKGVEFKAYSTFRLPHARVIAIESEREFGLSVLERLDEELRRRGDTFRNLGVQDVQGFRAARPEVRLPRILLVIDEFQELFVDDDRVAQTAALLLDRLVRQGRAFGIHVLLGSQTLAGAYSLPRSTIGQMAVRIALQCSEADAHLILSEENTAARLLTRPGEAIYNDANGQYEGNHPFQVVWLSDAEREKYLRQIDELAKTRNMKFAPAIVFEGNVPADPESNHALHELLAAPGWPESSRAPKAWLGEAVAIKDPTAGVFARQSGSNLLICGHREELALGILATSLVALAAQDAPAGAGPDAPGARCTILDGTRPDAPEAGFWRRVAAALPHQIHLALPRDTAAAINEVAEELARRERELLEDAPPVYLFIYNLARFRDLRRAEDDFGFSRTEDDRPPSPAEQLAAILREGPALGIHTLLWCDTYNNLNNVLDRQALRQIDLRVLFQMNATDSSNLIDSASAAGLGVHRAVLYNEGVGRLEKFRPYRLPSNDWLDWVHGRLHGRKAPGPIASPDSA